MGPRLRRCMYHAPATAVLAVLSCGWTAASWRRWGDLLIDTGRELYVPWRLSEGDALYRDIAYLFGPLPAYFNALLMRVFGAGMDTLFWPNLLLTGMLTAITYGVALRWLRRWQATGVAATFLCACGFSHLQAVGNYNFIMPYAQPLTHGLLLGAAAVLACSRFVERDHGVWLVFAAGLTGLTLLCKPEPFLATACTVCAAWLWSWHAGRLRAGRWWKLAAACGAGFALPVVLYEACAWIVSGRLQWQADWWIPYALIGQMPEAGTRFYASISGMHAPLRSVAVLIAITAAEALAGWLCWIAVRSAARRGPWGCGMLTVGLLIAAVSAVCFAPRTVWIYATRPLPVVLVVLLAVQLKRTLRARHDQANAVCLLLWVVFAATLLLKLLLRVQLDHYGFALAAPALLLTVGLALGPGAERLAAQGRHAWLGHAAVWIGLLAFIGWSSTTSLRQYRNRNLACGIGRDLMYVQDNAKNQVLLEVLGATRQPADADATLAALPDWIMLNYLTRRVNPAVDFIANPFELELVGERRIVDQWTLDAPDDVLTCARDTTEMGAALFGIDYGRTLQAWINARYEHTRTFGTWPPTDAFGATLWHKAP